MRRYAIPIPNRTEGPQKILPSSAPHSIFKRLIDEIKPTLIVEIGTCQGGATVHMASLTGCEILTVDKWDDEPGLRCKERFLREAGALKLGGRILSLHMKSNAAAKLASAHGLAPMLVYIDGGHDEASVTTDIEGWLPLIPLGGVLFGHDFNKGGVANAVKNCLGKVETEEVFWIWRVS